MSIEDVFRSGILYGIGQQVLTEPIECFAMHLDAWVGAEQRAQQVRPGTGRRDDDEFRVLLLRRGNSVVHAAADPFVVLRLGDFRAQEIKTSGECFAKPSSGAITSSPRSPLLLQLLPLFRYSRTNSTIAEVLGGSIGYFARSLPMRAASSLVGYDIHKDH